MEIYLPIAKVSVNVFYLIVNGLISGVFSGLFGIGGGLITTSFLIFMGISPAIAVSSSANQMIAASISGLLFYYRKKLLDLKLAIVMTIAASIGSILGIIIFHYLDIKGFIDYFIIISYVCIFGANSLFIFFESLKAIRRKEKEEVKASVNKNFQSLKRILPFTIKFHSIEEQVSILIPIFAGFIAGVIAPLIGIGGGFVILPIMIYILQVPTKVAIGTSLFLITITPTIVTFLQILNHHTVDLILVWIMSSGAVFGAVIGSRLNSLIQPAYLRLSLSIVMMLVISKIILVGYKISSDANIVNIHPKNTLSNNLFSVITNLSLTNPYLYGFISIFSTILIGMLANSLTQTFKKLLKLNTSH